MTPFDAEADTPTPFPPRPNKKGDLYGWHENKSNRIKGEQVMARGGKRRGAGRPKGSTDKRTAAWREYLRQNVNWPELVEAIVSKAKEGNIQASKLLIETAFGTAASMATLEEKEQVRMSIFSPELLEEWRKEAELAGVVFSEPDESSAETPPGTNGPE